MDSSSKRWRTSEANADSLLDENFVRAEQTGWIAPLTDETSFEIGAALWSVFGVLQHREHRLEQFRSSIGGAYQG